jgi:hypothetical protein
MVEERSEPFLLPLPCGLPGRRDQSYLRARSLLACSKTSLFAMGMFSSGLLYWDHRMFVECIGPHHVRLGWVRIGSSWIAQRLAGRAEKHDVRSCNDPMAVGVIARCIWAAVANSTSLP